MDQRMIFYERLSGLKEQAEEKGRVLTREEVRGFFSGAPLEEEHFQMIFRYLEDQKIKVAETEEEAGELRREQEGGSRSLSLYLDELERLNQEEDAPAREVFARAAAGEQEARKELIDWYLPLICRMAGETEDGR